jgi:hypothetical protein
MGLVPHWEGFEQSVKKVAFEAAETSETHRDTARFDRKNAVFSHVLVVDPGWGPASRALGITAYPEGSKRRGTTAPRAKRFSGRSRP